MTVPGGGARLSTGMIGLGVNAHFFGFLLPHVGECLGQEAQQIGRDQRILADRFTCEVARQSVKIDGKCGSFERALWMLRD
jgi:hypothetical protein